MPANPLLKRGNGVSQILFEAAGKESLEDECRNIIKKHGRLKTGEAIPTLAYGLNSKYIIHAVVPKWEDGNNNEYGLLSAAYLSALKIADLMNCESIAFPLLASGNNGFDPGLAFEIAIDSIESYEGNNLKQVILVIYGSRIASIVKERGFQFVEVTDIGEKAEKGIIQVPLMKKEVFLPVFEYLKDQRNRRRVINAGIKIAEAAIALKNKDMGGFVRAVKEE